MRSIFYMAIIEFSLLAREIYGLETFKLEKGLIVVFFIFLVCDMYELFGKNK